MSKTVKPAALQTAPEHALMSRALVLSIALHLGLLAAFTVRAVFYPSEPLVFERAMRVDLVGLPDKLQQLPQANANVPSADESAAAPVEPASTKSKVEPVPTKTSDAPVVNLDGKKKPEQLKRDQESALKRLEAMQKLEQMMKDRPKQASASNDADRGSAIGGLVRGNAISPGSSLRGTARLDHENYKSLVDEHLRRHWNLPQWLANANFKARALVHIDARGNVVKKQLTSSSGNQVFDERVMLAIESSSPFPPPPDYLANLLAVDGIEFGFPE